LFSKLLQCDRALTTTHSLIDIFAWDYSFVLTVYAKPQIIFWPGPARNTT